MNTLPELPTGLVIVEKMTLYETPKPLQYEYKNVPFTLYPGVYRVSDDYRLIYKLCNIEDHLIQDRI